MDAHAPAGPSRARSPVVLILLGLLTSAASLFLVWLIDYLVEDFYIMGWTAAYIFPAGAILVGIGAGSGYGLGSFASGVRISRGLLALVIGLEVLAFVVAHYIEYLYLMAPSKLEMGFLEFIDVTTRSMTFESRHGAEPSPLGAWGYAFRALQLIGFVAGGLIVPLALRAKPYCEQCQLFMRTRQLTLLPASVKEKKIKKKDSEGLAAHAKENEQAYQAAMQSLESLRQASQSARVEEIRSLVGVHQADRKAIAKLPARLEISTSVCPACQAGQLNAFLLTGQGKQLKRQDLGQSPIPPGVLQQVDAGT